MRIAVYGTGGVGGYFGGRLAQAGEDVFFIARGEHLQALRANGLQVESIKGDFRLQPVQCSDDPRQAGQVDAVLVAVKAWQVPEVAPLLQPMVGEETLVVPLENGVDAPAQLAAVLGSEHVLGGLCRISAFVAGPGHIRHVGIEPSIAFGELDRSPSQRVERLRQVFERTEGMKVEVPEDIHVAMWQKFVFIAAISGMGAITRAPVGVFRSIPETRRMLEQALEEVVAVGRSRKVELPENTAQATLQGILKMAPDVLASMQRDILEGRPSELGSQSGAVVRMGLEAGVPTPVNTFIYHSLLPQELRARGEVEF